MLELNDIEEVVLEIPWFVVQNRSGYNRSGPTKQRSNEIIKRGQYADKVQIRKSG